jgi:hypothetical protein
VRRSNRTPLGPAESQHCDGELDGLEGWLVDRVAEVFQHVRFNMTGNTSVDGSGEARDVAEPGQQDAGQPDRPTAAMLGGQTDKLHEDSPLEVIGGCWVLE